MSWLRFFRRKNEDADLREEMQSFLAEEIAEHVARGLAPEEAERRARIKLGNPQRLRETLWQQNTFSLFDKLGRDLKYALRTLVRTPGFSLIAIAVMALCISAATSLFTIVHSVLMKPLPFRDADRLVIIHEHFRGVSGEHAGFQLQPGCTGGLLRLALENPRF